MLEASPRPRTPHREAFAASRRPWTVILKDLLRAPGRAALRWAERAARSSIGEEEADMRIIASHPRNTAGSPPRHRASPVLALLLAAGAASLVLALGLLVGDGRALAGSHATEHGRGSVPARELALRQDMRALWEDHVTWTRMAIVDLAAGSPGLGASRARLLRNQTASGTRSPPTSAGRRASA